MKLIDAEALKAEILKAPVWTGLDAIAKINTMPSIDLDTNVWCEDCKEYDKEQHNCPRFNRVIRTALEDAGMVSVVRCKACKWYDNGQNESDSWNYCTRHFGHYIDVNDDDFCSYGEREGE